MLTAKPAFTDAQLKRLKVLGVPEGVVLQLERKLRTLQGLFAATGSQKSLARKPLDKLARNLSATLATLKEIRSAKSDATAHAKARLIEADALNSRFPDDATNRLEKIAEVLEIARAPEVPRARLTVPAAAVATIAFTLREVMKPARTGKFVDIIETCYEAASINIDPDRGIRGFLASQVRKARGRPRKAK